MLPANLGKVVTLAAVEVTTALGINLALQAAVRRFKPELMDFDVLQENASIDAKARLKSIAKFVGTTVVIGIIASVIASFVADSVESTFWSEVLEDIETETTE